MVSNQWITQLGNRGIKIGVSQVIHGRDGISPKKSAPESERQTLIWVLVFIIVMFIFWLVINTIEE